MKRLLLALLLLPSIAFAQFPTTPVLDTFDGTANPIGGIWTNTVFGTGGCQKSGGIATKYLGGSIAGCYVTETFGADQEAHMQIVDPVSWSTNTTNHVLACLQPTGIGTAAGDGYALRMKSTTGAGNDQLQLFRVDDSTWVSIADQAVKELAANDSVGIEIRADGTINAYHKTEAGAWTLVITATDTTYDCEGTHIGMNLRNSAQYFDNFGGGDLVEEEPPPPATFPTHGILDDFNRTDENPIGGIWVNGVGNAAGTCQVVSGTLREGTNNDGCYVNIPFSPPIEAYMTLPNHDNAGESQSLGLYSCLQQVGGTGVDGYRVAILRQAGADSDIFRVERISNNGATQLGANIIQEVVSNDKVGSEVLSDGTINVYINQASVGEWVLVDSRIDPSPHNCNETFLGLRNVNPNQWVDDFSGGGFGFAPPALNFFSMPMEFK